MHQHFPGWQAQYALLQALLQAPFPPAVLVHAPHSPARAAALVRAAVHAPRIAHTSPLLAPTPAAFFADVARQLGVPPASDMPALLDRVRGAPTVIVVADAPRMRDMWPEGLWLALPRLAELAGAPGHVAVVLVSALPWAAFRTAAGDTVSFAPVVVRLPRLGRADTLALLAADVPDDSALHRSFCALLYDSAHTAVRDEQALRLIAAAVWRVLATAMRRGLAPPTLAGLRPHLAPLIRDALAVLVPRIEGPVAWAAKWEERLGAGQGERPGVADSAAATNTTPTPTTTPHPTPPIRTGYSTLSATLLIAAFLASYNPTNTDVKYYVRELGASRTRRRRRARSAADAALDELEGEREVWNRPQFWGPRTFVLERLLAIFHALLGDVTQDLNEDALCAPAERAALTTDNARALHHEHIAGEFWSRSAAALGALNALVEQRLVVRMSPAGKLGGVQYRVNAPYAHVHAAARVVGFPLHDWLWDWHK